MTTTIPTRATHPALWRPPDARTGHHHVPTAPNLRRANEALAALAQALRREQGGGGAAFVVQHGIYVPLQYTDMGNPLQGGYGWCDRTDNGMTFHPGVDLNSGSFCNADEGVEVVASAGGVVVAILPWDGRTSGEGNHLWVYFDDPRCIQPAYGHFDHLQSFAPGLDEGMRFVAGQLLGRCGRTGNWECAHLHSELARSRPASWWQWPYGWSLEAVQAAYFSPRWWYDQTVAKAAGSQEDEVRTTTTPEEREAVKPYFELLGVPVNMDTGIMQRAALAYYRDETRGPALTGEYPATAPDGTPVTRQSFTAGVGEAKPQPDGSWWTGWVEVVKEQGG